MVVRWNHAIVAIKDANRRDGHAGLGSSGGKRGEIRQALGPECAKRGEIRPDRGERHANPGDSRPERPENCANSWSICWKRSAKGANVRPMRANRPLPLVLAEARGALHMSQSEFGPAIGSSHRSVVRWEAAQSTPAPQHLAHCGACAGSSRGARRRVCTHASAEAGGPRRCPRSGRDGRDRRGCRRGAPLAACGNEAGVRCGAQRRRGRAGSPADRTLERG